MKLSHDLMMERMTSLELDNASTRTVLGKLLERLSTQEATLRQVQKDQQGISCELTRCTNWVRVVGIQRMASPSSLHNTIGFDAKSQIPEACGMTTVDVVGSEVAVQPEENATTSTYYVMSKHAGQIMIVSDKDHRPIYALNARHETVCIANLTGSAQECCGKPARRFRAGKLKINSAQELSSHLDKHGITGLRVSCNIHQRNTKDDATTEIVDGMKILCAKMGTPTQWSPPITDSENTLKASTSPSKHCAPEKPHDPRIKKKRRLKKANEDSVVNNLKQSIPTWEVSNVFDSTTFEWAVRQKCFLLNPFGGFIANHHDHRFGVMHYVPAAIAIQRTQKQCFSDDMNSLDDPFEPKVPLSQLQELILQKCLQDGAHTKNPESPFSHYVTKAQASVFQTRLRAQGLLPHSCIWLPCPWLCTSNQTPQLIFCTGVLGLRVYLGFFFEWLLSKNPDEWWFLIGSRKRIVASNYSTLDRCCTQQLNSDFFNLDQEMDANFFIQVLLSIETKLYPWRNTKSLAAQSPSPTSLTTILSFQLFTMRSAAYFNQVKQQLYGSPLLDKTSINPPTVDCVTEDTLELAGCKLQ
jgi:hypothetical protein